MKVRNRDFHIHKIFLLTFQFAAGAGGSNTIDNSQMASNFAGLVLLDDNAHIEHVKSPVIPNGVKEEPRSLNLKTELEGALRFNEQLGNNDQGDGGEGGPREVKSINTEVISANSDLNISRLTAPAIYCTSPCWCNYRCFSDGQGWHSHYRT